MLLQPFCPCGSQIRYPDCCDVYLRGKALAPTAEALMRSRYSAYSKGDVEYLIQTQYPKKRKNTDRPMLLKTITNTNWMGLTVLKTQKGGVNDRRGIVEFVALYRGLELTDPIYQLHERSRFLKEDGVWFYQDGDSLPPIPLK
ncbi:MAG: YchJ family metal-binding protein [Cyanobacteria bacterium]|nr:YchJ family metal-binding protein [Cyanobacteriota bacterium]